MSLNVADCRLIEGEALPLLGERETVLVLGVAKVRFERQTPPIDPWTYFGGLGFERVITIDASAWEGCDQICDLNRVLPANLIECADLVVDPGTLEHVFNIRQALDNVARMLKVGGVAFHHNPLNWGNHGFYNLSPAFFHDAYEASGFDSVTCGSRTTGDDTAHRWHYRPEQTTILPGRTPNGKEQRHILHCIARKQTSGSGINVPQQRRYTEHHWR